MSDEKKGEPKKTRLSPIQVLAAKLVRANLKLQGHLLVAKEESFAHLKETTALAKESHDLRAALTALQFSAAASEIEEVSWEHGLPTDEFGFGKDEDGWFMQPVPKKDPEGPQPPAPAAPPVEEPKKKATQADPAKGSAAPR